MIHTPVLLLVEDNPVTRRMVGFALERERFEVLFAPDGRTALELAAKVTPDLILHDLLLPDIDGYELVRELRKLPGIADIPILAFSGFLSKEDESRILAAGFDDLIIKPMVPSQLVRVIRGYVLPPGERSAQFGNGRVVVAADDDPVQLKLLSFRLAAAGFRAVHASNGAQALDECRSRVPDLVVSDVLMPHLDGFGLAAAIRADSALAHLPVVLVTNGNVEEADRELAARVGATDLVHRTPDLSSVLAALRKACADPRGSRSRVTVSPELEKQCSQRIQHQLERQVALNVGIVRQCAALTAELSVLSGISEAISKHQSIDLALDEAVATCFDAGGISLGALYLVRSDGSLRIRQFGAFPSLSDADLDTFFGFPDLLRSIIDGGTTRIFPAESGPSGDERHFLARSGAVSALVVPLRHRDERLGALLMLSKSKVFGYDDDRTVFAQGVASQIAQALILARTFDQKARGEDEARAQNSVLRSILQSMADAVVVMNEAGELMLWNKSAEALDPAVLSRDASAASRVLLHSDGTTPYSPDELPIARARRGESVDGAEVVATSALRAGTCWYSINARPLLDDGGVVRGGVAVIRDVTEQKRVHEQLTMADRMAAIGMLAAGVGHEINNPLASVMGNLDMAIQRLAAQEKGGDPSQALADVGVEVREALAAAERVRQIVRDLKVFSRPDGEKKGPVNVEGALDSCVRMAWNEIRHRARLVKEYGGVPAADANEGRLCQVFLNLLVNAAQAIPEGRAADNEIRVTTRVGETGSILVSIADTGGSIPPAVVQRLFEPFLTTKAPGAGTGLGLAICRRIVTELGGRISAENRPTGGAVFHVELPAAALQPVAPLPPAVEPPRVTRRGRILVIDDDPGLLAMIRRLLNRDHEVVACDRGEAALALLGSDRSFDLILCDLMMPHITGMDFHERLGEVAPELTDRVIFLTGGAFTDRARQFLERIPNRCLEKPFDIASLRATISAFLR